MKMNFTSPIWLQSAGNLAKGTNYFYFESLEDSNIFSFSDTFLGDKAEQLAYSLDAKTWNQLAGDESITRNSGEKLYVRCINGNIETKNNPEDGFLNIIDSSKKYAVGGDVTLLIYESYSGMGEYNALGGLFAGEDKLISASKLILPKELAKGCFLGMFYNCVNLTESPVLPSIMLASSCYCVMFDGCSSLTAAPELPATSLAPVCYQYMFSGCTSLTVAPKLLATSLEEECYDYMFSGCTSLTTITCLASSGMGTHTTSWLNNASGIGTFTKATGVEWPTGGSGIPAGWTVIEQQS